MTRPRLCETSEDTYKPKQINRRKTRSKVESACVLDAGAPKFC